MKNLNRNIKAEEILGDDALLGKLKSGQSAETLSSDENEVDIAKKMHSAITNQSSSLSTDENVLLKTKLKRTIRNYRTRRIIFSTSAAAAIIFAFVSISILYFYEYPQSDIANYALNIESNSLQGDTRLLLHDSEEIIISSSDSEIEYTENGEKIKIDANQEVDQEVSGNKLAFNTVIVPYGKRTQITLSDNTKIWLNSGTKLIYPSKFTKNKREVFLSGEAIFDVAHNDNQPFHVISKDMEIKVLGTVFNVSAYADDEVTSTVLERGSVEIKYKSNSFLKYSKIQITPGTLATYNPSAKEIKQETVDTRHYTSWRNGTLIFQSEPLENITKKLSRYYNMSISIEDERLSKETFSGYLDLKNSALQVLNIISETTELRVFEINNQLIIK